MSEVKEKQFLMFFQDRSIPSAAVHFNDSNVIEGTLTGALYFPTTTLQLNQAQDVAVPYTIIVADKVALSVNTLTIKADYSSLVEGSPIRIPRLVE